MLGRPGPGLDTPPTLGHGLTTLSRVRQPRCNCHHGALGELLPTPPQVPYPGAHDCREAVVDMRWGTMHKNRKIARLAAGVAAFTIVITGAIPAYALENVSGTHQCSAGSHAYVTGVGRGIMYLKPPGAPTYYQVPYDPDFRTVSMTVRARGGAWGASAEVLLQSVTYPWCQSQPPIWATHPDS